MAESVAFQLVKDLYHLNRNFCSSDYDESLAYINRILPLKIHRFTKKDEFNGWAIPPKWDLVKATIKLQGKTIFEVSNPLQIIGLSAPLQTTLPLEELCKHLHFDIRDPQSTPYHFRQNYRPWDRNWGFCVSKKFYDSLKPGLYDVEIVTKEGPGYLQIGEYTKPGEHKETFAFVAHLDHPGMANDDLAGVAVGIELFRRLSSQKTKFTYRLVLVQEMIGSVFYLGLLPNAKKHVLESCFLEMLGTDTELALQHSRQAQSLLEQKLEEILIETKVKYRTGPFRSIICNDEPVWESYGIPMASLSRFPYPEYHSDKDNIQIIKPERLEQSVKILQSLIEALEKSTLVRKHFEGVLALSNPAYDLYIDPGQPAFGTVAEDHVKKQRLLMDLIPMFPREMFIQKMTAETGLPAEEIIDYLKKWEKKKLLELI
jgi:aminopeptidase-like protein